jgi:hypothetical protein
VLETRLKWEGERQEGRRGMEEGKGTLVIYNFINK